MHCEWRTQRPSELEEAQGNSYYVIFEDFVGDREGAARSTSQNLAECFLETKQEQKGGRTPTTPSLRGHSS